MHQRFNVGFIRAPICAAVVAVILPFTAVSAQRTPFVAPSVAGAQPRVLTVPSLQVQPFVARLGIAPDDERRGRDTTSRRSAPIPVQFREMFRDAPSFMSAAPTSCPMPVTRADSASAIDMPRIDPPRRDAGGVAAPACINPLDRR